MNDKLVVKGRVFYGWWVVVACAAINFFIGGVFLYGFTAFFNPIVDEFGWTYAATSLAISIRSFESGFATPIVGFLVDRFGPKRLLLFGVAVIGLGFVSLSRIHALWSYYAAFIVISAGFSAASTPVTMAAATRWFRKRISLAMGIMTAGTGVGGLLVPAIVWLIARYEWRGALVILGVATWLIVAPLCLAVRDRPEKYGYLPDGDISVPAAAPREVEGVTVREALRTRDFWLFSLAVGMAMMASSALAVHQMPYLASIGVPRQVAGLMAMLLPLSSIAGRLGFGWLGDVFDKRYCFAIASALNATGIFALWQAQDMWQIITSFVVLGVGLGGVIPLRAAVPAQLFGTKAFGAIQGLLLITLTVGGMVAPVFTGWVFDIFKSYRPAFLVLAIASLAAIPAVLAIRQPRRAYAARSGASAKTPST